MDQSRVHSLLSVWVGIGLMACATEMDDSALGPPTDDADLASYASELQRDPLANLLAELRRRRGRPTRPTTPDAGMTPTAPDAGMTPTAPDAGTTPPAPTEPSAGMGGTTPPSPASYLWTDSIQTSDRRPWGFSQIKLERPIGRDIEGNSECNLTRVANPIGAAYALKHVATFDSNGGSRSQAGIYSFANDAFDRQVKSPEGIWIAQEWYFPEPIEAGNRVDTPPWVNLWDFHSVGSGGGSRWDTQPALMLAEDGSMRIRWAWHYENADSDWSPIRLPVGEWFDIEMHYVWSSSGTTVSLWINGELALQQRGVKTKGSGHNSVETYMKFYGSAITGPLWNPLPSIKYTRNVRMSNQRIWR